MTRRLKRLSIIVGLAALFFLAVSGCYSPTPTAPTKLVVKSQYTKEKVKVDGRFEEEVWRKLSFSRIPTKGGPDVLMKSAYSEKEIYFLIEWEDATNNNVSKVWEFDGKSWKNGLEQDKLAILWNRNDSIAYFDIKGCQAVCHTENSDKNLWYMAANRRQEKIDLWFWMAGIGNIYGHVDDRWMDDTVDPTLQKAARKPDRGEPGFYKNGYKTPVQKIAPDRPTKMLIAPLTTENTPYPKVEMMFDITSYKIFKVGDKQPFIYFYGPPTDSRGDVRGKGIWQDGKWMLEIKRRFNTGHRDDMVFEPSATEPVYYMFGVAVFDHSEPPPIKHFTSAPLTLALEPRK